MHTYKTSASGTAGPARGNSRTKTLVWMLVVGGFLSLVLYRHGALWWYAPLAFVGFVLAHMAMFGGVVFLFTRAKRRTHGDADGNEGHLIRRPRLYDWLVRAMTLGGEKKLRQRMLDLADLQRGSVVLDVGCGTGTLLLAAAERVGGEGALHGVEPAPEMVAHARRKANAQGVSIDVVEASADSLPYEPALFDAVFCTLVLHHLAASMRETAIREMCRLLRPGGRLVIVDMQPRTSRPKPIRAALSLISVLHGAAAGTAMPDYLDIEPLLTELGVNDVVRHSFGSGAIGAIVGRLNSSRSNSGCS